MPHPEPAASPVLTRKEVCFIFGWSKTTLWRRERDGLPFFNHRTTFIGILCYLAARDAAHRLRMKTRDYLALTPEERARRLATLHQPG